jgi:hypothetical protein
MQLPVGSGTCKDKIRDCLCSGIVKHVAPLFMQFGSRTTRISDAARYLPEVPLVVGLIVGPLIPICGIGSMPSWGPWSLRQVK